MLPSWHQCVTIHLEDCKQGKFAWASLPRIFIAFSLCKHTWSINFLHGLTQSPALCTLFLEVRLVSRGPQGLTLSLMIIVWPKGPIINNKDTHHWRTSEDLEIACKESGTRPDLSLLKAKFFTIQSSTHQANAAVFSFPGMPFPWLAFWIYPGLKMS